jgi:hypothetical protein
MADNKYGRIFTAADVEKVLQVAEAEGHFNFDTLLPELDKRGVRFKFPADEPLFILRGRDKRALGAIRFYQDHQSPRAPVNHTDAIAKAFRAFDDYANSHPGELKEPD